MRFSHPPYKDDKMIKFKKCIENLCPYIPGRPIDDVKREFGLTKVVKIASNENPYGCSPKIAEALKNYSEFALYPDGNCTSLREKLSCKLNISANKLIFGAGTDELISLISKAIIEEGDECITASITFSQYEASVLAMGGKMVFSEMQSYAFDLNDILNKITNKTKIIFIANPNNPTGTAFSQKMQIDFLKNVPKNILVVFDEAYGEFAEEIDFPNTLSLLSDYENIILLKTFSKAYGLASFRIGYGVANANIISNLEKIRNPFNVSSISQIAAIAALEDTDFLKKTQKMNLEVKKYLCDEFDKLNLFYIPTYTNFIMVDLKKDSRMIFQNLMKEGFIIRPGSAFNMDSFIRISFGTMEEMREFMNVLKKNI